MFFKILNNLTLNILCENIYFFKFSNEKNVKINWYQLDLANTG